MAMEIDEAIIRVDNHAEIDEVEPIEISDDEARRVRLYENFYQVNAIDPALYAAHDVKRGLRNADGTGVLAGMTNISNVHGYVMSDGEKMPAEGSLRLRGYDLYDLLGDLDPTRRFAFEEVAYLLLMGLALPLGILAAAAAYQFTRRADLSIVLFIAVGIVIFLMLVIVPKFKAMFAEQNQELPGISEFVFGISDWFMAAPFFVPNAVILAAVVAILYAVFTAMSKTPNGRRKIDSALLTMPVIGNVQSKSAIARFARTFGTLVTSGVPILQALTITKDTAGNMIVGDAIGLIHDSVKEGESVVTPMSSSKLFPPMVISMVDVGEETGQLPDMLLKIADVYDDEVDNAVGAMTSMLEPIMIVFLAVVVGGIVFAMFLPLLQVIEKMG